MKLPYRKIERGEAISITVTGDAIAYVAIEVGKQRSGGYENSLPENGWKAMENGAIKAEKKETSVTLIKIFSKSVNEEKNEVLPATTTEETVMLIIVVPNCQGKSFTIHQTLLCKSLTEIL